MIPLNLIHYYSVPEFTKSKEYMQWAINKHPEMNMFAFLGFIKERDHATRLEF